MTADCSPRKGQCIDRTKSATNMTRAIEVSIRTRSGERHFAGKREKDDHAGVANLPSRPQELAGGFVDFLLGRGTRYRK